MKTQLKIQMSLLLICTMLLSGCEVVEGIFKAGVWTGVLLIVLVIALIIFIISWIGGKRD